jgi:hypothetical protein
MINIRTCEKNYQLIKSTDKFTTLLITRIKPEFHKDFINQIVAKQN